MMDLYHFLIFICAVNVNSCTNLPIQCRCQTIIRPYTLRPVRAINRILLFILSTSNTHWFFFIHDRAHIWIIKALISALLTLLLDSAGCGLWNGDFVIFRVASRCQKSVCCGGECCGQTCRGEGVPLIQFLLKFQ